MAEIPFEPYTGQSKLRFWCQKVLPLVYDDSLSYYELLGKVVEYLNNTITDVSACEDNITALRDAFVQLQDYVNEQLEDITQTVENVIDEMIDSGEFGEIIADAVNGIIADEYDETTTYVQFAYCLKDGKLYCATAPTTGTWDETKWRETTVGNDLQLLSRRVYNLNAGQISYDNTATYDTGTVGKELQKLNDSLNVINPLDYGAKYDGTTDCTTAIQTAVNNASGKIIKFSGNGTALISQPIVIKEDTHIILDKGFTLKMADASNCPMFKNAPSDLNYNDSQAGQNIQNNISIIGGTLDFNGNNQTWQNTNYRLNTGIILCDVNNLLISDVELIDPITFGIFLNGITNFTIKNIFCNYSNQHNNMDGIHLGGGCGYGTIENIYGTSNDDFIALNSGDTTDNNALLRIGATHDIAIKNIKGKNAYRAIRLLAGNTNHSELYNISIDGIYGSYRFGAVLMSTYRTSTRAYYRNISIKNVICDVLSHNDLIVFQGNYTTTSTLLAESISIENVFSRQGSGTEANIFNITAQSTISNLIINNVLLTSTDIDLSSKYFITGNGTINGLIISNIEIKKPTTQAGMLSVNSTLTKTDIEVSNFLLNGVEVGYLPGENIPISGQWYGMTNGTGTLIGLLVSSKKILPTTPMTSAFIPRWVRANGVQIVASNITFNRIERVNDYVMNIVYDFSETLAGATVGIGLLDVGSFATF